MPPGSDASDEAAVPSSRPVAAAAPAPRRSSFGASLGWTLLGTLLPGLGLWPTRARRAGLLVLGLAVAAAVALGVLASTHLGLLAQVAVRPGWLHVATWGLVVTAAAWVLLVVVTHLMTRPRPASAAQRALGALFVGLLSFAVATPLLVAARYAKDQAGFVYDMFPSGKDTRSQTRPAIDSLQGRARVNILLLGGDSNAARDKLDPTEGIRTDTTMLLSVDTSNGSAVLVQLPRNMSGFHFPAGSPLAAAYPHGYWSGVQGDRENPEFELNSVWDNVPRDHPDLFRNTDYPNADAVKYAVEGITGLKPDYFVLLNIDGIQKLIDAMGGVTVNVNQRIPMAQTSEEAEKGIAPRSGYLEPGANRHLTGYEAMWYARSRSQSKDPDRMARQGCVVKAIVDQANPQVLLTRYESIANAGRNALATDMPREVAPSLVQLAVRMRDARLKRVLFGYPTTKYADGSSFEPWNPDEAKMRQLVQRGIDSSEGKVAARPAASTSTPAPSPTGPSSSAAAPTTAVPGAATSRASSEGAPSSGTTASVDPGADLSDACAYHPNQG